MWGGGDCWVSANDYSCAHGAQINFGDITPYLTHDQGVWSVVHFLKLRQIRTHGVLYIWEGWFPSLAGLVGPVQENIFLTLAGLETATKEYFPCCPKLSPSPCWPSSIETQCALCNGASLFNVCSDVSIPKTSRQRLLIHIILDPLISITTSFLRFCWKLQEVFIKNRTPLLNFFFLRSVKDLKSLMCFSFSIFF